MAALFDVARRAAETADQKVAEALFGPGQIVCRVHRPQDFVVRNTAIERGRETGEPVLTDQCVNVDLLHGRLARTRSAVRRAADRIRARPSTQGIQPPAC